MNYKAVWKPLPGSQSLSLSCPCNEILYEGTRGPGKTAAQLARFRRNVGVGYGSFWRGVIFDTEYKNLADIITQSKRMYNLFGDGANFLRSASELRWVWPTGEELLFRFGSEGDDYWNFHGQEFPFIGFNELTKQPNSDFYEAMFSCRRSSFRPENYPRKDGSLLRPIPLEVFSTTNPFGIGHTWVKKRFIEPAPRGTVQRHKQLVFNPQTEREEEITLTRVAIHDDGKEIGFDAAQAIGKITELNGEAKSHRLAKESAETNLAKFSGITDPAKALEALEMMTKIDQKKLIDAGAVDQVRADITKSFQAQLEEANGKSQKLEGQLYDAMMRSWHPALVLTGLVIV